MDTAAVELIITLWLGIVFADVLTQQIVHLYYQNWWIHTVRSHCFLHIATLLGPVAGWTNAKVNIVQVKINFHERLNYNT